MELLSITIVLSSIHPSLLSKVLRSLHSAHQGTSSMTSRAESSVFWPGITYLTYITWALIFHSVIAWPHLGQNLSLLHQLPQSTPFSLYVHTSSTLQAFYQWPITLSSWIATATGTLRKRRRVEQKASYPALKVLLLPLVLVMSCHLMGAQNSPPRPHRLFSKTAEHDTAYLHWPILIATVEQR